MPYKLLWFDYLGTVTTDQQANFCVLFEGRDLIVYFLKVWPRIRNLWCRDLVSSGWNAFSSVCLR